jgi:16S rRNA (guanine527-N7)-methyltransferase
MRMPSGAPRGASRPLETFVDLLRKWNATINLVGENDAQEIWERHVAEALQLTALIPPGTVRAIDLGSGAGFPGLVLALATGIHFDLLEADLRKAAFLREAARLTEAPVTIFAERIEQCRAAPATLITARALAPLPRLLGYAAPLLTLGGSCLFPKGTEVQAELTAAARRWQMRVETLPNRVRPGVILRISELAPA